jgi:hypothetical protein
MELLGFISLPLRQYAGRWATATRSRKNQQYLFLKKETYIFTEN